MYFDSHAHYDSSAFDGDRDAVLASLLEQGVEGVIDPGCDEPSSRAAVELSRRWPFVYAAVGWQPEEWASWDGRSAALVRSLAADPKVVAIGEIGLDYYWDKEHKELQREMFRAQLAIARELGKPVIVHDREAHADCLDITAEFPQVRGTFHCFSGSAEMAEILLRRGWYLGFDGPITFKNNKKAAEVLSVCPMDRILIETDSPYLSPEPLRGKRNHSGNLRYIAETIAALKGVDMETTAAATTENARRLFGL
jgi:TatD DNase family protein